jgi:hypothetical protein
MASEEDRQRVFTEIVGLAQELSKVICDLFGNYVGKGSPQPLPTTKIVNR